MRSKGYPLIILGIALIVLAYFLLNSSSDVVQLFGGLSLGVGGASVVSSFVYLFGSPLRYQ